MALMERMSKPKEGVPYVYHSYKETLTETGITDISCNEGTSDDIFDIGHSELDTNIHWCMHCPDCW